MLGTGRIHAEVTKNSRQGFKLDSGHRNRLAPFQAADRIGKTGHLVTILHRGEHKPQKIPSASTVGMWIFMDIVSMILSIGWTPSGFGGLTMTFLIFLLA
jgi:hypothetical protein